LVRHGRTEWNEAAIFRGKLDIPLDEVGQRQANLAKQVLSREDINYIISSPLKRARETAEIIAQAFPGVEVQIDERVGDIDVGEWAGVSLAEVQRKFPEDYRMWVEAPHKMKFPGGESLKDVQEKAWEAVMSCIWLLDKGGVLLVSHRVILKTIILKAVGAGLDGFWKIRLDTASVSVMEYNGVHWVLTKMNDTSHLGTPTDQRDF